VKLQLVLCSTLLCGTALFAQEQPPPAPPKPAVQQAQATPATPAAPAATDPALLHVYRARRYAGSALSPSIYLDDKQIARVGSGRRVTIRLTPGAHTIRSDDKSSAISLDAKSGQDYYIRVDEETGFWKGHGKLTLLLPEQGAAEYKLQKPVEPDRRINKELIVEDSETAPGGPKN
jgi:Protein of unknown function (DUF2846)